MIESLACLSILFLTSFYWGEDFHGTRLIAALTIGAFWFAGILWRRVHPAAAILLEWVILSAAWHFAAPISPYSNYGEVAAIALGGASAAALATVLMTVVVLIFMRPMARGVLNAFAVACLLDSVFVLIQWLSGGNTFERGGFLGNTSINACFIACTYPILKRRPIKPKDAIGALWGLWTLLVPISAIIVSRSNMALASLLAAFLVPMLLRPGLFSARDWRRTLVFFVILLLTAHHFMGAKMGDDNGRVLVWRTCLEWWMHHANIWVGTGIGTFATFGANIQRVFLHRDDGYLLWMHNDWLQILFELGIGGLLLALLTFGAAIWRASRRQPLWIAASLAAFGTTMCGNYPLHLPMFGLLGGVLLALAFEPGLPRRPNGR